MICLNFEGYPKDRGDAIGFAGFVLVSYVTLKLYSVSLQHPMAEKQAPSPSPKPPAAPVSAALAGHTAPPPTDRQQTQELSARVAQSLDSIRYGNQDSYIRVGSEGEEVKWLKSQLIEWGTKSGKLDGAQLTQLRKSVSDGKFTGEWADVLSKFQHSVGLDDNGGLITVNGPGDKRRLASDQVLGIRTLRALDLYMGRTVEANKISWDDFKNRTGGIWSVQQQEAANLLYTEEQSFQGGAMDYSGAQNRNLSPKAKVGYVSSDPEFLIKRGIAKDYRQARNLIAFLAAVSNLEGTANELGYQTQYGGGTFDDLSRHPNTVISAGRYNSSAAGKYQFMCFTYKNLGMPNMEHTTQDLGAIQLLKNRHVLNDVLNGDFDRALSRGAAAEWASLPRWKGDSAGYYGQIRDPDRYNKFNRLINDYRVGVDAVYGEQRHE